MVSLTIVLVVLKIGGTPYASSGRSSTVPSDNLICAVAENSPMPLHANAIAALSCIVSGDGKESASEKALASRPSNQTEVTVRGLHALSSMAIVRMSGSVHIVSVSLLNID